MENIDSETLEKLKEITRSSLWQFDQLIYQYKSYYRHGTLPGSIEVMRLISKEITKQQS